MKAINAKSADLNESRGSNHSRVERGSKVTLRTYLEGAVKSIYTQEPIKNAKGEIIRHIKVLGIQKHECVRVTNISEEAVASMINAQVFPYAFEHPKRKFMWTSMSEKQRLLWHLGQIADGNHFEFEIIN